MSPEYICYCFRHTREALEEDVRRHGRSTIMEQIMLHLASGTCACSEHNPQGR